MARPAAAEIVIPTRMSPEERQRLADALYDVHSRIFDGVDKASFVKYVIESKAEHTWIQLHKDEQGAIVGYFALHIFERALRGERAAIVRGEAGMLSAYRGANVNGRFGIERVLRYMLANPGRRVFYLGSLVHPSSYAQLARYVDRVFPSPAEEPAEDVLRLMRDLADEFHLDPVDEANPLLYKVGWKTIDTAAERERWLRSDNPAVRFFLAANPGYAGGHGLLTMAPIDLGGVLRAGARFAVAKARRWGRQIVAWTPELPAASAASPPALTPAPALA
jgi:hypothetical protein